MGYIIFKVVVVVLAMGSAGSRYAYYRSVRDVVEGKE